MPYVFGEVRARRTNRDKGRVLPPIPCGGCIPQTAQFALPVNIDGLDALRSSIEGKNAALHALPIDVELAAFRRLKGLRARFSL